MPVRCSGGDATAVALDPAASPAFRGMCMRIQRRALVLLVVALGACRSPDVRPAAGPSSPAAWETENPLRPLPQPPPGSPADFAVLPWVTPAKVRLGRWLFYDPRLSADGTISCATCHRPENAFSEPTAVSTGIHGEGASQVAADRERRLAGVPAVLLGWPGGDARGAGEGSARERGRDGQHARSGGAHRVAHPWVRAVLPARRSATRASTSSA